MPKQPAVRSIKSKLMPATAMIEQEFSLHSSAKRHTSDRKQ
jgi:hypothetical protein